MTCTCRKFAPSPDCDRPEHTAPDRRVSSPAFYEERIRILTWAFKDALLALHELDHEPVAQRLRERWPETQT